jgi:RNA polymerase-interacting CarD/CdnL/TRCF family regulator
VLRKLAARKAADHLGAGEREMDERLRRALSSELAYALGVEKTEARARVERALCAHARRAGGQPDGARRSREGPLRKAA